MFRRFTLLVLYFLLHNVALASNPEIINALNQKAEKLLNFQTDSAIAIARQALEWSENIGYEKGKSEALSKMCFAYYIKGEYDLAIDCCTQSIEIAESIDADVMLAYHALGLININKGKNDEAIRQLSQLTEMAIKRDDLNQLADACVNLGLAYLNKKFYQRSREYHLAALRLYKNIEQSHGEAFCYLNYGRLFFEQNEYDSAAYYFNKSINLGQQLENERVVLHAYSMMGQIEINYEHFDLAEYYFSEAYAIAIAHNLLWEKANLSSWLAETYFNTGDYTKAIEYGNIAMDLAKQAHIIYILQKISNILAKSYLQLNNINAAENHVRYLEHLIDSLALADSTDLLRSIIDVNLLREEEKNYEFVTSQLAVARAELLKRNIFLAGTTLTILLMIIILALIIRSNHFKTKSNQRLQKLNEEVETQKSILEQVNKKLDQINQKKDLLMGIVAHDIRSPLNKIAGLVNILDYEANKTKEQAEIFMMIRRTITDAQKLAGELLEINRIESGIIELNTETLRLKDFIAELVHIQNQVASEKRINIQMENEANDLKFVSDRKMLQRILENLLSNAIKFSESDSSVTISTQVISGNLLKIAIKDQGPGIPHDEQNLLFKKFGKTSIRPTGTESSNGLGLYIVDQLAKAIDGKLFFESEPGRGSIFGIEISIV